jgi:Protein of unknown function (DUF1176)
MGMRFIQAGVVTALLAVSPLAAEPELGKQVTFKNWTAACDNILSCEAVSLLAEDTASPTLSMALARSNDGTLTVKFSGLESKSDRYRIVIDRRSVHTGALLKADYPVQLSGPAALKLVRAAARGGKLELRDDAGASLGSVSLAGSNAAFRHIDSAQKRTGTQSALAAIGGKRFRAKSAPEPIIRARRIAAANATPDVTSIVKLVESSGCTDDRTVVTEDSAYSLGERDGVASALVLVACGSGAYNYSTAPYVGTSKDGKAWQFAPARFDYVDDSNSGPNEVELLTNADWDQASQQISSFAKGRGLGDCGSAESYVWDGAMFRLVSASGMSECRGSMEFLSLWRAKVELTD